MDRVRSNSEAVARCLTWSSGIDAGRIGPDAFPTHVAGHEQFLSSMRPYDDVVADDGSIEVVGLVSTGYAVGHQDARTTAVLARTGPIAASVHADSPTLVAERRGDRSWTHQTLVPTVPSLQSTLERQADALLSSAYGDAMRLDVLRETVAYNGVENEFHQVVKADRVAYKGRVRFNFRSCAYSRTWSFVVDSDGVCVDRRGVTYVRGTNTETGRKPYRFVGLTRYVAPRVHKATGARKGGSKRGRTIVVPMRVSERSLRRLWSKADAGAIATASELAQQLRMLVPGTETELVDGVRVKVHAATVTVLGGKVDRVMSITEASRRAALTH